MYQKLMLAALVLFCTIPAFSQTPRIFIEKDDGGFHSFIAAAITQKKVPATVTTDPQTADYVIRAIMIQKDEKSGLGKIARCAYAFCWGIEGNNTATVQVLQGTDVVYAYNVRKSGSNNFQSSAEAIAKHLKQYLKKN